MHTCADILICGNVNPAQSSTREAILLLGAGWVNFLRASVSPLTSVHDEMRSSASASDMVTASPLSFTHQIQYLMCTDAPRSQLRSVAALFYQKMPLEISINGKFLRLSS